MSTLLQIFLQFFRILFCMANENHASNNWVAARSKCNGKGALKILLDRMDYDVNEFNKESCNVDYRVESDNNKFSVIPEGGNDVLVERGIVSFRLNTHKIHIKNSKGEVPSFFVKWHWDAEAMTCYFCVNEERKELWEISQMALSPSFFPEEVAG